MKKGLLCMVLCAVLAVGLAAASAAPGVPQITFQPQNICYPEYSVASYTVKASGSNLSATWYLQWQGNTYNLSDSTNGIEPWEGYAGETYGPAQDGSSFTWFFSGIGAELSGGYIWCVLEDGHYDVESQKAMILVGDYATNPQILDIPAQLTVEQGKEALLRCVAKSTDGSQLSYLWYETDTGMLQDIRALDRGTEDCDFILCDTEAVGTRNYVCMVSTSNGGMAYSSVVPVTVTEKSLAVATEPQPTTEPLIQPTTGSVESEPVQSQPGTEPEDVQTVSPSPAKQEKDQGVCPLIYVLVGLTAAAAAAFVTLLVIKKKK